MFLMSSVRDSDTVSFGDDVEFTIQTRNGKESAVDISKLPTVNIVNKCFKIFSFSCLSSLVHLFLFSSTRGPLFLKT